MIGVDTNLLVRFLVNDDKNQAKKTLHLFQKAEKRKEKYFVSILVLLELIWVLRAVYKFSREEIIFALENLIAMQVLKLEKLEAVHKTILAAKQKSTDLSDLLIANCSVQAGCDYVLTFDKKAAKNKQFKLL